MVRLSQYQIADAEISEGDYRITIIINANFRIFVSIHLMGGWTDYNFTDLDKVFAYIEKAIEVSPDTISQLREKLSVSLKEASKERIPQEISYITNQFNGQSAYFNHLVEWAGLTIPADKDQLEEFDEGTRDASRDDG